MVNSKIMMWLAVAAVIFLMTTLFLGHTTIQFSPFKIKVEKGLKALGYGLVVLGALMIESSAYMSGGDDMLKQVREAVNELKKGK